MAKHKSWFTNASGSGPDYEHVFFVYIGVCIALYAAGQLLLNFCKKRLARAYPVEASEFDAATPEDVRLFCYTCAAERLSDQVQVMGGEGSKGNVARQCCGCGYFLHEEHWLPDLVHMVEDYHEVRKENKLRLPIDPRFPVNQFSSVTEEAVFLAQCFSSAYNLFGVIQRFVLRPKRDDDVRWNMTILLLAWFELIAILLGVLWLVFTSTRLTLSFKRRHPFRVWVAIALSKLPQLANINALSLLRFWDVTLVVTTLQNETYVEHAGPECWNLWVKLLFLIVRVPAGLLMVVLPIVGVLTRLLQLEFIFDYDLRFWSVKNWLVFLGFMNNFRFLASRPQAMKLLGLHLLQDQPVLLFAEVVDAHSTSKFVLSIATLITSGTPSELFQIFRQDSDLWLTTEEQQQRGEHEQDLCLPPKAKKRETIQSKAQPRKRAIPAQIVPLDRDSHAQDPNPMRMRKAVAPSRSTGQQQQSTSRSSRATVFRDKLAMIPDPDSRVKVISSVA